MRERHTVPMFWVLMTATAASAQHFVEYGLNLSLGIEYIEQYQQGAVPGEAIIREIVQPDYGRIAGVANVGFGVNKARVDLAGTNPNSPFFFEYGFASSRYWDSFTFDDPALNGTHGFFDVTLFVAGVGAVNLSPEYATSPDTEFDAFWHAVINVSVEGVETPTGPIQSVFYAGEWYKGLGETSLEYYGDQLNTYQQTRTFEFIYGEPILMDSFLQLFIQIDNQLASVPGTLDATIDLGNSTYWGGISNLRDQFGNPVNPASYSSSSGFDYRQSCAPSVLAQPLAAGACPGGSAPFSVAAACSAPMEFMWQIEVSPDVWQPLGVEPITLPCGGSARATQPASDNTFISVTQCPGVSAYRVRAVATSACGAAPSEPATLTVLPVQGDVDASGSVGFGDISFVLATWGAEYGGGTGAGDANGDGTVNFGDVSFVLARWGMTCP